MEIHRWVPDVLDQNNIRYQVLKHEKTYRSQDLAKKEGVSGHRVAKVVVVIVDGRPVSMVLPASRMVSLAKLRDIFDTDDVGIATERQIQRYYPDCEVGAIPPLNHWEDIELIMDPTMSVEGEILFQGGNHTEAIKVDFDDWFFLAKPDVADFSIPHQTERDMWDWIL